MSAGLFEANRSRLMGIAYGMLGSVMDAEDVVQEAYLRWANVDAPSVLSPAAYLTTVTTRLAIDKLRSAQHRRESYIGPWLPEPVVSEYGADPAETVAEAERLTAGVLTVLERLTPIERAVLLLREVFDMDYVDIADVVDKSPANCRQIASRARQHGGDVSRRPVASEEEESRLLQSYLTAMAAGDVDALAEVFAEDVVLWSDGGGKVRAARHVLSGAWRVARHLVGVAPQTPANAEVRAVRVNGDPGFIAIVDGASIGVISFEIRESQIIGVRVFLNPEKLAHLALGESAQTRLENE